LFITSHPNHAHYYIVNQGLRQLKIKFEFYIYHIQIKTINMYNLKS
ncbi:MAG: hypothetical protein UZ09_BCD002001609, partial [Bacteroidetes bacterium OLB9]